MRAVGGIDPGLDGACAVIEDGTLVYCEQFEAVEAKTRGRELIMSQVWHTVGTICMWAPELVYVERVQAMPRQGASSGFKFGVGYGAVLMACAAAQLPMKGAEPRLWMKAFNISGGDDDGAIRTACQLFPRESNLFTPKRGSLTKANAAGKADAALIALWGYRLSTH